jgi:hypothetical protein
MSAHLEAHRTPILRSCKYEFNRFLVTQYDTDYELVTHSKHTRSAAMLTKFRNLHVNK